MFLMSAKKILVLVDIVGAIFLADVNDFGERKRKLGRR